jgi:hypothetical protein
VTHIVAAITAGMVATSVVSRAAFIPVVSILAALLTVGLADAAPADQPCLPSVHSIGGQSYQVFCGKGHATVKVAGKTTRFGIGGCTTTSTSFTVNVGAAYLGTPGGKPARPYFGIAMGTLPIVGQVGASPVRGDGTYSDVPVSFIVNGARYLATKATVRLTNHRTRGSFSGSLLTGGSASGTFAC